MLMYQLIKYVAYYRELYRFSVHLDSIKSLFTVDMSVILFCTYLIIAQVSNSYAASKPVLAATVQLYKK